MRCSAWLIDIEGVPKDPGMNCLHAPVWTVYCGSCRVWLPYFGRVGYFQWLVRVTKE